jgi:hypothetical protein
MPTEYHYVKIGKPYICLQQSPLALAWFLYFKGHSLQQRYVLGKRKTIQTAISLLQHQLHSNENSAATLKLPVYGNLCLEVHRGYRVFDYRQNAVTRIINANIEPNIVLNEIQGVRNASQLDFAPNVLHWDIKDHWYREVLIVGLPCHPIRKSESAVFRKTYQEEIINCLEQMILLQAPLTTNVTEYVSQIMETLEGLGLSATTLDVNQIDAIRCFIESIAEQLSHESNRQIDLVFSHGDFSLVNILKTRDRITVIDWEGARRRSTLFDFYNFFFTEIYYQRAEVDLASEINEAISGLQARLAPKAPRVANSLSSLTHVYRKLYYLERILTLLERELSNKLLDVIARSIKVFNHYEETTTSN